MWEFPTENPSLQSSDVHSSASTNPLSHFRFRLIPNLQSNGFDQYTLDSSDIHSECEEILKCSIMQHDFEMFEETLWLITDEKDQYTRKALIMKYIRLCSWRMLRRCPSIESFSFKVVRLLTRESTMLSIS